MAGSHYAEPLAACRVSARQHSSNVMDDVPGIRLLHEALGPGLQLVPSELTRPAKFSYLAQFELDGGVGMDELPDAERRRRKVLVLTLDELNAVYADWAAQYDEDLVDALGYAGPSCAAKMFSAEIPKDSRILDIGAGTGQVGEALHAEGFRNLEALDASPDMLDVAREKSVYSAYFEMTLSKHLEVVAKPYDAVVSIGTMTVGHLSPKAFDEMARITKTGGWIVFSLIPRIAPESGYRTEIDRLTEEGTWRNVTVSEQFPIMASRPQEGDYNIWVFQVL